MNTLHTFIVHNAFGEYLGKVQAYSIVSAHYLAERKWPNSSVIVKSESNPGAGYE